MDDNAGKDSLPIVEGGERCQRGKEGRKKTGDCAGVDPNETSRGGLTLHKKSGEVHWLWKEGAINNVTPLKKPIQEGGEKGRWVRERDSGKNLKNGHLAFR